MALVIGDNFSYQGSKPLDARIKFNSVTQMALATEATLYNGILAYVEATKKYYTYDSSNELDGTLGKWREFKTGSSITIDSAISGTSENPVQNKVIKTALDGKIDVADVGTANGVAELDSNGKIPNSQLPSYVDDVVEYATAGDFPETGETGKIYVATSTNLAYRWGGSDYVEISPSIALGETSATAYRGDRGKTAYDISQTVGDVADLDTTAKDTIVNAINEVKDFDNLDNRPVKGETSISSLITPLPGTPTKYHKYSTEEQVVGEWIDGKPIYQRTFSGIMPETMVGTISIIENIGELELIDVRGTAKWYSDSSSYGWMPIPQVTLGGTYSEDFKLVLFTRLTGLYLWVSTRANGNPSTSIYANQPYRITIQYTKTTDA